MRIATNIVLRAHIFKMYTPFILLIITLAGCYGAVPEGRVINGTKSEKHSWIVEVVAFSRGAWRHHCGGSLLTQSWVLSAAHCFISDIPGQEPAIPLDKMRVAVGSTKQVQGLMYPITESVHLKYGWTEYGLTNDIILLRLKYPVLPLLARPVALPDQSNSYAGELGYTFGWGTTETGAESVDLMVGKERIIANAQCINDDAKRAPFKLCADPSETHSMACGGDSGGPLAVKNAEKFVLVGVTSYGDGDCKRTDVYTRVSEYLNWIAQVTGRASN